MTTPANITLVNSNLKMTYESTIGDDFVTVTLFWEGQQQAKVEKVEKWKCFDDIEKKKAEGWVLT